MKKERFDTLDEDFIYCSALSIFLIAKITKHTNFVFSNNLEYGMILLSVLIVVFKIILFSKLKFKIRNILKLTGLLFFLIVSTISAIKSGEPLLVYTFIFIVGAKNVKFESILKTFILVSSAILILTMVAFLSGLIGEKVVERAGIIRHSFGYTYPTDFVAMIFYIMLSDLYIATKKQKEIFLRCLGYFFVGLFTFKFCDARLGSFCILLLIPVSLFLKTRRERGFGKIGSFFLDNSLTLSLLASIFLVQEYIRFPGNSTLLFIDKLSSYRITLTVEAVKIFGYSIFGQKIYENYFMMNKDYFFIDSSYYIILIQYGLSVMFLILVGFYFIVRKAKKTKNISLLILILIISLNSIIGQQLYLLEYNPFLLLVFSNIDFSS